MRRETSADSAARFLAMSRSPPRPYKRRAATPATALGHAFENRHDPHGLCVRCGRQQHEHEGSCWIAVDFAEPTLRLIHDVLLGAMHANVEFNNRGALLMIAEQMVAIALGEPACDDPPLTDREPA